MLEQEVSNEQTEVNAPEVNATSELQEEQHPEAVVWYIQTGTLKGVSEQVDGIAGIIKGFLELLNKTPWVAIGEIVYASKQGFDSKNPYLLSTLMIAKLFSQSVSAQQQSLEGSIDHVIGGVM